MKHTKSVRMGTASVTNRTHTPLHPKNAANAPDHAAPVTKAEAHIQAAAAHSVAAERHKAAAVSGVGFSAEHQAAIAFQNVAITAHQAAVDPTKSGTSAQDTSRAGQQALQASITAEQHSLKALAASGHAPKAVAAHQASTHAAHASASTASAKAKPARGVTILNMSKHAQEVATATRQAASTATPADAAKQFVTAAARSAPLRHLWKSTLAKAAHLPLHQQMNHATAMLNSHGFKTTAPHVIRILGSSSKLDAAPSQDAAHFVNRMLSNPRLMNAFSLTAAEANASGGLRGVEEALRRFLRKRGYSGRRDHFQHALSHALVNQGRQWIGQYDKTLLTVAGKQIPGPSLTVENSPSGPIFRLNGKPIAGVTTTPASEFSTKVTWPATSGASPNGVAGAITFSTCKAHDNHTGNERYHGPAFTGTLTFVGPNAYGIAGTVTFRGLRTGAATSPSPAKVA